MAVSAPDPIEEQQMLLHQRVAAAQAERFIQMGDETAQVLKTTFDNATRSYKAITYMCIAMFSVGLSIFTISSVYGIFFTDNRGWALAFSGMGAGTFIAVFVTGAIRKTQTALSNLVQVDIAFMNFFEQITSGTTTLASPRANPRDQTRRSSGKPAKPSKPARPKRWSWSRNSQRRTKTARRRSQPLGLWIVKSSR